MIILQLHHQRNKTKSFDDFECDTKQRYAANKDENDTVSALDGFTISAAGDPCAATDIPSLARLVSPEDYS